MLAKRRDSMKVLVVYDSVKGNTEKIAKAIATALGVEARRINTINPGDLKSLGLLVIGSPTYGGRPTQPVQAFLAGLAPQGLSVSTFDTRIPAAWVKLFGFASDKMAKGLKSRGAVIVGQPAGFFVLKSEGPLKEGELERAASWAMGLVIKK
jgi:flavodoxin I